MTPSHVGQRSTSRWLPIRWVAAAVALLLAIGAIGWYVGAWGRSAPSVAALLSTNGDIHAVEATAELCNDPVCVEGWRTAYGNYLRFATEGEADYWVTVLGDRARRYRTLVLDMRSVTLSFDEQRRAIDILFSGKDWS